MLEVKGLTTLFETDETTVHAVFDVSFELKRGQTLCLVGESGSGKSVTAMSLLGLVAKPAGRVTQGEVWFHDSQADEAVDLLRLDEPMLRTLRGNRIAMIFQDPMTSLNPYLTVGVQLTEVLVLHTDHPRKEANARAVRMLQSVGLDDAERVMTLYPHALSGGMRQRVMIAMALLCEPDLLIADEPTTALDVTVQLQILRLLRAQQERLGLGILFITHDLGVVAQFGDEVAVMHQGRIVERAPVSTLLSAPQHPYTLKLLSAVPDIRKPLPEAQTAIEHGDSSAGRTSRSEDESEALLDVKDLRVDYAVSRNWLGRPKIVHHAVNGVSLCVRSGRSLGMVGESGCGKSTTARAIMGLVDIAGGRICLSGSELPRTPSKRKPEACRRVQMIFQNPYASLDPRMTVRDIIEEPLQTQCPELDRTRRRARVDELLDMVKLPQSLSKRYPHALSGGQRQRVGIARALALDPPLVIADEPLSALDMSIRAQLIDLLNELRRHLGLTYLLISHDLAVIRQTCDDVVVMHGGSIIERGPADRVFDSPSHPHTQKLLSAVLRPDPNQMALQPSPPLENRP